MAFQMIPPRLSSSPPPLDSLPSVACPGVDEDDEFDHFSSHNASFDITGLSDKLPPTPECSPSRFPGIRSGPTTERGLTEGVESTLEDSISQDSGVDSSNHPHEFSPQPQGDGHPCSREDLIGSDIGRVDRELSDFEQNDVDDFGDFQGVCSAGSEAPTECVDSVQANSSQNWDSSQISSQPLSQESETSKCKENDSSRHRAVCSPPPLDCVAEDTLVEDDDDADFGDFSSHEAGFDLPSGANIDDKCDSESSLHPHYCQPASEINTIQNECKEVSSSPSVHQISLITERLQADGNSEDEDLACKSGRVARDAGNDASKDEQGERSVTFLHSKGFLRPEDESEVGSPVTSAVTQTPSLSAGNERGMGDGMATSQENVRKDSEENTVVVPTASASGDGDEQRTGDKFGLSKDVPFLSSNGSAEPENGIMVREREVEPSSDTAEHIGDIYENENESDFGDFNHAKGDNDDGGSGDGEDEDDLDFGDLRKQVEEGMFGESDDFGDFSTGFGDGNEGSDEVVAGGDDSGDGEDDFGDFTASANTNVKAEFDDFGDFVVPEKGSTVEDDFSQDFSDDFGDFSAPEKSEALKGFTTAAVEEVPQFQVQDDEVCKTSPILQKLESLVTKWIPRTPEALQEESCSVPLLHQAIESDAFVWRQLENLESSAALRLSWSSTQAHNFFLSSVNVDARNIVSKAAMITLFGQKWSSSVPLFAQTLSFSPLTPAKSTEGSGGSSGVGLAGASKELPPDTFPATSPKQGQHKKNSSSASSTVSANGSSEEQIPPAKFDWTSSGLTNPLEGPGLEQEFLSEGEDKGSGGRAAKSPPTPSPLVQQILGGGMSKVPSPATPLQSLAPEVRQVVTQLPNLSFMRSRVLMFPIRGDQ